MEGQCPCSPASSLGSQYFLFHPGNNFLDFHCNKTEWLIIASGNCSKYCRAIGGNSRWKRDFSNSPALGNLFPASIFISSLTTFSNGKPK
jgi:hypothetical protein